MKIIYPSLMGADQLNLQKEIEILEPHVEGFHLDIADNHFAPNLTWGPLIVNPIAQLTKKRLWVHLMVDNPLDWLTVLKLPPASIVSFHAETSVEVIKIARRMHEQQWQPSIALKPATPIESVFPYLVKDVLDHIVIMSVEPGFSAQPFIKSVTQKLEPLRGYRETSGHNFTIAMDGGINEDNIVTLAEYGVDHFAISSAIFKYTDRVDALKKLEMLI